MNWILLFVICFLVFVSGYLLGLMEAREMPKPELIELDEEAALDSPIVKETVIRRVK